MPKLIELDRLSAWGLADQPMEANRGRVLVNIGLYFDEVCIEPYNLRHIGGSVTRIDLSTEFVEHLGARDFTQRGQISVVVSGLKTNKLFASLLNERGGVKTRRPLRGKLG